MWLKNEEREFDKNWELKIRRGEKEFLRIFLKFKKATGTQNDIFLKNGGLKIDKKLRN